jgi:hypothetical protein
MLCNRNREVQYYYMRYLAGHISDLGCSYSRRLDAH